MTAAEIVLGTLSGWTALSLVAAIALLPLLRSASRSDARGRAGKDGRAEPGAAPRRCASPAISASFWSGSCSTHARLRADEVCVFGQDRQARGEALVLVQGAGVDPELVGRVLTIEWDPDCGRACLRPAARDPG